MKIVKDGKLGSPKKWKTNVTCKKRDAHDGDGCGAVMKVAQKDLQLLYWKGSHFDHFYPAVKCPQCGKFNPVEGVPQPIWKKMDTYKSHRKATFDGFSDRSS